MTDCTAPLYPIVERDTDRHRADSAESAHGAAICRPPLNPIVERDSIILGKTALIAEIINYEGG